MLKWPTVWITPGNKGDVAVPHQLAATAKHQHKTWSVVTKLLDEGFGYYETYCKDATLQKVITAATVTITVAAW